MTKARKGLLGLIVAILLALSMSILYGCDTKGGENCITSGHGTIVTSTDDDGVVTYTAVADKWNIFTGWFDGLEKYSDDATIVVNKKTPDGLVAKFESSGTLSVDRILGGAYYRYSDATAIEGEYLNMSYDTSLSIITDTSSSNLSIERGGYVSLDGSGFNDYAIVKKGEETLFSSYLTDNAEKAMLYIDSNGNKVAVDDFASIGHKFFKLPNTTTNVWTLKDLVDNKIYSTIENYIGFRNSVGFIQSVENAKNQTKITFNIDALLNELKDKINAISDPDMQGLKDIVNMLTSEYAGINNKLPNISLSLIIDYQTTGGIERISKVSIRVTFDECYKFSIEGKLYEIPACTMNFMIENANFWVSNLPNAIPTEIISTFPEAVHAINVHSDGTLVFLEENVATRELSVIDEYKIELDTDIDINAFKDAISDDGTINPEIIDWQKFGFLSLRITLVENPDDPNQSLRHNGSKEYLNILIDTEKYGTKALVHIDLYNPKTMKGMATSTYILNNAFDIPELARVMPEIIINLSDEGEEETQIASLANDDTKQIAKFLSKVMAMAIGFNENISVDELLFDLLKSFLAELAPNNQLIQEGLTFTKFGLTLAVDEVKDLIEDEFSINSTLSGLKLQNNIFGEDTTHIAIKENNSSYGTVVKNNNDEYIDGEGKSFVEEFNSRHKMLIGVAEGSTIAEIDNVSYTANDIEQTLTSLIDTSVIIANGKLSDGTTSPTLTNSQGNEVQISMKVYSANYRIIDENTAQITVYLTYSIGTLPSLLVNTFDIPYGIISYTTTVNLA